MGDVLDAVFGTENDEADRRGEHYQRTGHFGFAPDGRCYSCEFSLLTREQQGMVTKFQWIEGLSYEDAVRRVVDSKDGQPPERPLPAV